MQEISKYSTVRSRACSYGAFPVGWAERLPWFFILGVSAYMFATNEPSLLVWLINCLFCAMFTVFFWHRKATSFCILSSIALCFSCGMFWGGLSAEQVEAPTLHVPQWKTLEGTVAQVESRPRGVRIMLSDLKIWQGPNLHQVRVFMPSRITPPSYGQRIRLRAYLMPLPEPVHPQSYNLPRHGWFQQLGAVGYSLSPWELRHKAVSSSWKIRLHSFRHSLEQRISALFNSDDERVGIVIALIVGERGKIPQKILDAYRGSGMAHILAISGLHMSLIAGFAYILLRRGLALCPTVALRYPIKKWAAALALLFTTIYLGLSGASVPTQRAFIMSAVALCAVILERSPFSLRLVGIAACIVVLISPDAVTGASFQMSFAAVLALISVYQGRQQTKLFQKYPVWLRWCLVYLLGVVLTTVIATFATAPVALYHFGRVSTYSVIANAIAMPIFCLWVMPCALISMCLLPFDAAQFPLECMAYGIGAINLVADEVMTWKYAIINFPKMTEFGYILCLFGGGWLALSNRRFLWLGGVFVLVGFSSAWWKSPPDILIADRGDSIAVRTENGYNLLAKGNSSFLKDIWEAATASKIYRKQGWKCDASGCISKTNEGWIIAQSRHPIALETDCANAQVVIASYIVEKTQRLVCKGTFLYDFDDMKETGSIALWLDSNGIVSHMDTHKKHQNNRKWRSSAHW